MRKFENTVQSEAAPSTNSIWIKGGTQYFFNNGEWKPLAASADQKELEEKVDSLDKEMGEVKNDISKFGSSQGVVKLQIGDSSSVTSANLKALQSIQSTDHTFLTDINYGYGTGSWIPGTGGNATIFTSAGHMVNYDITAKGEVIKTGESEVGEHPYILTLTTAMDSFYYEVEGDYSNESLVAFTDYVAKNNVETVKFSISGSRGADNVILRKSGFNPYDYGDNTWIGLCSIGTTTCIYRLFLFGDYGVSITRINLECATEDYNGLMAKEDKQKLDSLIQIPSGGQEGQVLTRDTSTDSGIAWKNGGTNIWEIEFNAIDMGYSEMNDFIEPVILGKINIIPGDGPVNPDGLKLFINFGDYQVNQTIYLFRSQEKIIEEAGLGYWEYWEYIGYHEGYIYKVFSNGPFVPDNLQYKFQRVGKVIKEIAAPATLSESASNAEVIARVNSIINGLISSGTFKD